jgi:arginine-tRNA-protein transferase
MTEMVWPDFVAMIEDTPVRSHLVEYRRRSEDGGPGELVACTLVDLLADGLSMVYSFYDPEQPRRSLGRFMILDHLAQARRTDMAYVYLGYWVRGSAKMDYKVNFQPIEALGPAGWRLLSARDREG